MSTPRWLKIENISKVKVKMLDYGLESKVSLVAS